MPVLPAYWEAICPACLHPYGPDFTTREQAQIFQTAHPTCHDCQEATR